MLSFQFSTQKKERCYQHSFLGLVRSNVFILNNKKNTKKKTPQITEAPYILKKNWN